MKQIYAAQMKEPQVRYGGFLRCGHRHRHQDTAQKCGEAKFGKGKFVVVDLRKWESPCSV